MYIVSIFCDGRSFAVSMSFSIGLYLSSDRLQLNVSRGHRFIPVAIGFDRFRPYAAGFCSTFCVILGDSVFISLNQHGAILLFLILSC